MEFTSRDRVLSFAEDSPSGLWRSLGKRVGLTPSGVRIPYPPPRGNAGDFDVRGLRRFLRSGPVSMRKSHTLPRCRSPDQRRTTHTGATPNTETFVASTSTTTTSPVTTVCSGRVSPTPCGPVASPVAVSTTTTSCTSEPSLEVV